MKSAYASALALAFAASNAFAQQFQINTPSSAVVCQPLLISWTGGQAPYFLSILPGGQPQAPALVTFNSTSATSVTWLVDIAAQTSLGLDLRDSTGDVVQSAAFSVQPGPNSSCLGTSSISFGTTAASGTTPTGSSTSGSGATIATTPSTSGSFPLTISGSNTSPTTSPTASTPTKSAGASRVTGPVVAAGILGAAMVALLG